MTIGLQRSLSRVGGGDSGSTKLADSLRRQNTKLKILTEEDQKEAKLLEYLKTKRLRLEGKRDRQYKRMLMIFTKHKKRRAKIPGDHTHETGSST